MKLKSLHRTVVRLVDWTKQRVRCQRRRSVQVLNGRHSQIASQINGSDRINFVEIDGLAFFSFVVTGNSWSENSSLILFCRMKAERRTIVLQISPRQNVVRQFNLDSFVVDREESSIINFFAFRAIGSFLLGFLRPTVGRIELGRRRLAEFTVGLVVVGVVAKRHSDWNIEKRRLSSNCFARWTSEPDGENAEFRSCRWIRAGIESVESFDLQATKRRSEVFLQVMIIVKFNKKNGRSK